MQRSIDAHAPAAAWLLWKVGLCLTLAFVLAGREDA